MKLKFARTTRNIIHLRLPSLSTPSRIALAAGVISILFAPIASLLISAFSKRDEHAEKVDRIVAWLKSVVAWSTIAGIVIAVLSATQIQCMLDGGCRFAAWTQALILLVMCLIYVGVTFKVILSLQQEDNKDMDSATSTLGSNPLPAHVASNPLYSLITTTQQSLA
jgi:ABC-type transport system involved in cytochrome c biogenesis permease subunit